MNPSSSSDSPHPHPHPHPPLPSPLPTQPVQPAKMVVLRQWVLRCCKAADMLRKYDFYRYKIEHAWPTGNFFIPAEWYLTGTQGQDGSPCAQIDNGGINLCDVAESGSPVVHFLAKSNVPDDWNIGTFRIQFSANRPPQVHCVSSTEERPNEEGGLTKVLRLTGLGGEYYIYLRWGKVDFFAPHDPVWEKW